MDLGLDPVVLARARREGWELIAMTVHLLENPVQNLLRTTLTQRHHSIR